MSRKRIYMISILFSIISLISVSCKASGVSEENISINTDVTNEKVEQNDNKEDTMSKNNSIIKLKIGDDVLTATLVDNSSTAALKDMLAEGPLTISMRDYANMEKVGSFGKTLPTNNQQITTGPGDLILYQGSAFVIYYAPNSWNFTRLGKINDVTQQELKQILGSGSVDVTLSLE
ncbi:MAG: cyclophilin-like fold protein [Pleomorphochaeta sp.]